MEKRKYKDIPYYCYSFLIPSQLASTINLFMYFEASGSVVAQILNTSIYATAGFCSERARASEGRLAAAVAGFKATHISGGQPFPADFVAERRRQCIDACLCA